ncbi:hypothetical protein BD310DRAFT_934188 [Dichomitus squalens]|uniref:Uncharacterized protein n=1 Tax=Dichomitus squalens TaxID=114155 RepID=A0A4Q9PM09_9APHY|nr:hypothetical protein BD310DRAFT_934188 [Dichomitus squalens]
MSATASNVTNLLMSLNAPPVPSSTSPHTSAPHPAERDHEHDFGSFGEYDDTVRGTAVAVPSTYSAFPNASSTWGPSSGCAPPALRSGHRKLVETRNDAMADPTAARGTRDLSVGSRCPAHGAGGRWRRVRVQWCPAICAARCQAWARRPRRSHATATTAPAWCRRRRRACRGRAGAAEAARYPRILPTCRCLRTSSLSLVHFRSCTSYLARCTGTPTMQSLAAHLSARRTLPA